MQMQPTSAEEQRMPQETVIARLARLQELLALCPTDILTRSELAMLFEELHDWDEAVHNWKAVIEIDPNNLKAREGLIRCRHMRNAHRQRGSD